MNNKDKFELSELFLELTEGSITSERMEILNERLCESAEAFEFYRDFMKNAILLKRLAIFCGKEDEFRSDLWKALADQEKIAPALELPQEIPSSEPIRNIERQPIPKRINRGSLVTLVLSAAAVIVLALVIRFAPSKSGTEVATLTDSLQAKWGEQNFSLSKDTAFCTGRPPLLLREGLAELLFNNGARLVIEAPAEFEIVSDDRVDLRYGRVFASIPQQAIGFKIYSPSAQVIDLGTEFGMEADFSGSTTLQMIKGKATLIAGSKSNRTSLEVSKGTAKKVFAETETVVDVPYRQTAFVRLIDSAQQIAWKGQSSLDLADMIRNGNGLGTGNSQIRLDPLKGFTYGQHWFYSKVENKYLVIKDHAFIDGVFIPDGQTVISSRGDIFKDSPVTGGAYISDLLASPTPGIFGGHTIQFNGQEYSDRSKSCIVMHGNHGVTFDLDAVRMAYHCGIDQFTSRIGIADFQEDHACNGNFYVLVDGRLCYSLLQYKQKGVLNDVSIAITDKDRFLTLVTTDGEGANVTEANLDNCSLKYNWCVFTEPVLKLK